MKGSIISDTRSAPLALVNILQPGYCHHPFIQTDDKKAIKNNEDSPQSNSGLRYTISDTFINNDIL